MTRLLPSRIMVPEMPLAFWIAETEVPYFAASPESVSPLRTVWRVVLATAGLGFGFGLVVLATVGFLLVVEREAVLVGREDVVRVAVGRVEVVRVAVGFGVEVEFEAIVRSGVVGRVGGRRISGLLPLDGSGVTSGGGRSFLATSRAGWRHFDGSSAQAST